jgi:hypothetical protein
MGMALRLSLKQGALRPIRTYIFTTGKAAGRLPEVLRLEQQHYYNITAFHYNIVCQFEE